MANQLDNQTVQLLTNDSEIVKPHGNGRHNGQTRQESLPGNQTVQQEKSASDTVKAHANGWHNGWMRQELVQQFERQGVTQPLPVDFNDAISPRRRSSSSGSPLLQALAGQIEK